MNDTRSKAIENGSDGDAREPVTDLTELTAGELLWIAGRLEMSGTASPEPLAQKLSGSGREVLADRVRRLEPHQYQCLLWCAAHASAACDVGIEVGLKLEAGQDI